MGHPVDRALEVFHETVAHVPAYRAFLEGQGIAADGVRDAASFARLPW